MEEDTEYTKLPVEDRCVHKVEIFTYYPFYYDVYKLCNVFVFLVFLSEYCFLVMEGSYARLRGMRKNIPSYRR